MAKNEIVMENYFDALEKVKNKIIQTQNQVMTTANVERNILYWNIGKVSIVLGETVLLKRYLKT